MAVAALIVLCAALVATWSRAPEVVTADGRDGPDGSARTSTRAVTDLTPRWDVAWNGPSARPPWVRALHDLGDVLVVATDTELVAVPHPTAPSDDGGPDPPEPVRWRSPAVAGTPRPVEGRLPVVAGRELLWVATATGAVTARHDLAGTDEPSAWSPGFAVPAGDVLVTGDGTTVLDRDGVVRWQAGAPGEAVGVAAGTVVVRTDRTVTGRRLGDGQEVWTHELSPTGEVSTELVDGVVVTAELGGRVTVRDPRTGRELAGTRVGPAPAGGPPWDGGTSIVGTTATDVFVRLDAHIGIRYARLRASDGRLVDDLVEWADRDLRNVSEHAGYLVTVVRDTVEVWRGGEVAWTALEPAPPPTADGSWLVRSDDLARAGGGSSTPAVVTAAAPHVADARPAVAGDHAVVATPQGVQALELATGEPGWSRPLGSWSCCPSHLVGAGTVALTGPVRVLDADGERRWDLPEEDEDRRTSASAIAPPWLVVTERPGPTGGATRLHRLADGRAGPRLSRDPLGGAVVAEDRLFALGTDPAGTSRVVAFDVPDEEAGTATVAPVWTRPTAAGTELVHVGDELLVVGAAVVEHLDPATGQLRRRTLLPGLGSGPVAVADGRLVRRLDGSTLEAVHLTSGERWTRSFARPLTTAPTIAGDVVYVADTASVVVALSLRTGAVVASVDLGDADVAAITVAGGAVLAGGPDRLHALGAPPSDGLSSPVGRRGR